MTAEIKRTQQKNREKKCKSFSYSVCNNQSTGENSFVLFITLVTCVTRSMCAFQIRIKSEGILINNTFESARQLSDWTQK